MGLWLILLTLGIVLHTSVSGILYPRESESREVLSLDGKGVCRKMVFHKF